MLLSWHETYHAARAVPGDRFPRQIAEEPLADGAGEGGGGETLEDDRQGEGAVGSTGRMDHGLGNGSPHIL